LDRRRTVGTPARGQDERLVKEWQSITGFLDRLRVDDQRSRGSESRGVAAMLMIPMRR